MFARVITARVPLDMLQVGEERTLRASARMRELPGGRGSLVLVDRDAGKLIAVTLWEDRAAVRASEEAGSAERREAAEASAGQIVDVEEYEVVELVARQDAKA